jgi:hypothetical protein
MEVAHHKRMNELQTLSDKPRSVERTPARAMARWTGAEWCRAASLLLAILLLVDLVFITLHMVVLASGLDNESLLLNVDQGYAEVFQYQKYAWLILLSLWAGWTRRRWRMAGWSLLFAYLLADDVFRLHEHLGLRLSSSAAVGEAIGGVLLGVGCIAGAWVLCREPRPHHRRAHWTVAGLLILLAAFGVGVDAIHGGVTALWGQVHVLDVIEDGGEHVVVSALVAVVFSWGIHEAGSSRDGLRTAVARG